MTDTFKYGKELVFAEPSWYQFFESPYYTEKHVAWRAKVRAFVDAELAPNAAQWEEDYITKGQEMPLDWVAKAVQAGVYAPMWDEKHGGTPPAGGWDAFMDLIWCDEVARAGCSGVGSVFTIPTMALPLLMQSGNEFAIDRVARNVLTGKKMIALAISEPYAGSDVANIRATAVKQADGSYILNGEKKWITLGIWADYFIVAARTGPEGHKGLSVFLVEKTMPGVSTKRMKLMGHWCSGTAMVFFEDVKVPASHLLGTENKGFRLLMHNFNHERFVIAVQSNRGSRALLHASMEYANKRKTFGKTLLQHQVIRQKLADMAMRVESVHALLENMTYQMQKGLPQEKLGGLAALLKVLATRTLEFCVREASQIFGGSSFVRGGVGAGVERAARDVRGAAVPGGSDEILADLAIRQAMLLTMRNELEKGAKL